MKKKGKAVATASSGEGRRSLSTVNADAATISADEIKAKIYTIRGAQVMLDRDLASLYGVLTKNLNKAVKRNLERFPEDFMFRLTKEECLRFQSGTSNVSDEVLAIDSAARAGFLRFQNGTLDNGDGGSADDLDVSRFQSGTLKLGQGKHFKYQPYAFTENGIAMLSSVLHSDRAIEVNIKIMREFVAMRKTLAALAPMFARIEANERRQIADQAKNDANQERNEERFRLIFDAMQDKTFPPQKVFYNGQVFDAKVFAAKHILSAKKSILLIDSWVDVVTLELLAKKAAGVTVEIVASHRGNKISPNDIATFNKQYGGLTVRESKNFHDRFLIIDDKTLYLIGASLKDLGWKCFAFTKLDASEVPNLKARI